MAAKIPVCEVINQSVPLQIRLIESPTTAVACVFTMEPVVAVEVIAVPVADVFAWITDAVPVVMVNPAVVFPQIKVNSRPLAAAGRVHDGLPEVETLMNV